MDKKRIEIIEKAIPLFVVNGFRSVNMDDIAKHLSISKKTIYKYFSNKKDIIDKAIFYHTEQVNNVSCQLFETITDPIDQLLHVGRHFQEVVAQMNPSAMEELEKYYKDSWEKLNDFLSDHITEMITLNINNGKDIGLYRDDLDTDFISKIYVAQTLAVKAELGRSENKHNSHLVLEAVKYHLRGICTNKGLEKLNILLK